MENSEEPFFKVWWVRLLIVGATAFILVEIAVFVGTATGSIKRPPDNSDLATQIAHVDQDVHNLQTQVSAQGKR